MPLMEPYRIKVVEPIPFTTRPQREQALRRADYNLFELRAEEITIDLLTDSGTGALSAAQMAAAMLGDETYAGARSFHRFRSAAAELTSYEHILPTHQGRAAERILFSTLLKPGQVTLSNTHFDTTRANIELAGGEARDLPCQEAEDLDSAYPFKGNIDLDRLRGTLARPERAGIAAVIMTLTSNGMGGQPVSMANLAETSAICREHRVPLLIDAARFAENAWLVTQHEPEWHGKSPREAAEAAFRLADGCTLSMKKDGIVNIGGFLGLHDPELAARCELLLIATEGHSTYGGLAGRDLDMLAQGFAEATDPTYLRARARMTAYLAELSRTAGVAVFEPPGVHALYLNAGRLLPHLPPHRFPGQALACELYLEGGIRSAECGSLYLGKEDEHGNLVTAAPWELVRLAIPRRVYTQSHFEHVGETLATVAKKAERVPGYRITENPPLLRHFKIKLEPATDLSALSPSLTRTEEVVVSAVTATEGDVRRYYDVAGPAYSTLMQQFWHHGFPDAEDRGLDHVQTAKELEEHLVAQAGLRPEHWAIDFGAGVGGGTCHMATVSGSSWVGVSNNDWLSEQARAYAAEQGLGERVHFLTIGDTDYKTFAAWPDGSFQLFVFAESVCHLSDKQALFHAAYRILAPGGVLAGIDWLKRPYGQYRTDEQIMQFMAPVERWICIPQHGTVDSYRRMIENAGFRVRTAEDMWAGQKCWGSTPPDDGQGWYDYNGPQAEVFHRGKKALMDAKESGVFTVGLFIADKPAR